LLSHTNTNQSILVCLLGEQPNQDIIRFLEKEVDEEKIEEVKNEIRVVASYIKHSYCSASEKQSCTKAIHGDLTL